MEELNLKESRKASIVAFSEAYRLKPYVKILKNNKHVLDELKKLYPDKIKDNWDCVVELYRYNIKLSEASFCWRICAVVGLLRLRFSKENSLC
jgi:hypothetical protein